MNTTEKIILRNEYSKIWKDSDRMTDYCTNKTFNYAVLPDGLIIPIEKQSIETRFCFGESGFDYDAAADMVRHARTSQDYFRRENMEKFRSLIDDLIKAREIGTGYPDWILTIHVRPYTGQPDDCKIASIGFERLTTILDWNDGSAYNYELTGKIFDNYGRETRIATVEEINIILEKVKEAATAHEKKVNSYLKRYGLSKVDSWTYWRDA